jgi:hypothetical protein
LISEPRVGFYTENGAAQNLQRSFIFLHFSKFQNQKFSLKHKIYSSKHVHYSPRSKNHPFSAQESEGIEAKEGHGG